MWLRHHLDTTQIRHRTWAISVNICQVLCITNIAKIGHNWKSSAFVILLPTLGNVRIVYLSFLSQLSRVVLKIVDLEHCWERNIYLHISSSIKLLKRTVQDLGPRSCAVSTPCEMCELYQTWSKIWILVASALAFFVCLRKITVQPNNWFSTFGRQKWWIRKHIQNSQKIFGEVSQIEWQTNLENIKLWNQTFLSAFLLFHL